MSYLKSVYTDKLTLNMMTITKYTIDLYKLTLNTLTSNMTFLYKIAYM